jgi:hypothetical protein
METVVDLVGEVELLEAQQQQQVPQDKGMLEELPMVVVTLVLVAGVLVLKVVQVPAVPAVQAVQVWQMVSLEHQFIMQVAEVVDQEAVLIMVVLAVSAVVVEAAKVM